VQERELRVSFFWFFLFLGLQQDLDATKEEGSWMLGKSFRVPPSTHFGECKSFRCFRKTVL
jgi:hypothetical protein